MKGTPPLLTFGMTKKYISVRSSTDCHRPFPFGAKKALSLPLRNTPLPDPSDFVDSTCEVIPGKALSTGTWIRKVWQSLQKHLCCYVILWNSIIRLYAFSTEFWTCLVQSRLQTPTYSIEIYMWHKKNQSSELSFLLGLNGVLEFNCSVAPFFCEFSADNVELAAAIAQFQFQTWLWLLYALKITRVLSEEKDLPLASFAADTFCAVGLPE